MPELHIGVLAQPRNFHTEKWAEAIARAGAKVTVFSFEAGEIREVEVVQLEPPLVWRGRYRYPSYSLSAGKLRSLLLRHQVDVLHPLHLTPFGTWAVQSGFKPVIAAAMGADVLEYPPNKFKTVALSNLTARTWRESELQTNPLAQLQARLLNRFFRAQVQQVIHKSDLITADNQPLVDAIREWFIVAPEKVRLLRWGLEPELLLPNDPLELVARQAAVRQRYGIAPGARVVFSPRGANVVYQADIIIEAFANLLAHGLPDMHYLMLGAGYNLTGGVARRAAELMQRYPNFTFVSEQLPRLEVYALWSVVDVFISAPVYDGYSAAIAEGRYMGAIPVVNAILGNLEIIRHKKNGWVVDPFTPESLSAALTEIMGRLVELKAAFARPNREWILANSILSTNASMLVSWAEELKWRKSGL